MREYPGASVITVDDDLFYPARLIENLLNYQEKYPGTITSTLTRKIRCKNGRLASYNDWEYVPSRTEPLFSNQMLGVGGVLYPPGVMDRELFNSENIKRCALKTDDLWLKIMSLKKGVKVACASGSYPRVFIPIIRTGDQPLMANNVGENQNDKNLAMLMKEYQVDLEEFIE